MKLTYNDEKHTYTLDGRRCKSVTTVAKIPDDTYRLSLWSQRQVAIGMASDADLVEAIAAHANDDRKLDELCEQAKNAAGANRASRRGTAAHRVTELFDEGREIIETALSTAILDAWASALDDAGLEVVPELMERIVVWPERRVCGKFDRILRRKADGRLVIADLKSGARAVQYPHSIATQLALYANAPLLAAPLPPEGGTTTEFEAMPDVDRSVGYVVHIPEGGEPAVARFDIAAGWDCVERIIWPTLEWRDRKDIVLELQPVSVRGRNTSADDPSTIADALERTIAILGAKQDNPTGTRVTPDPFKHARQFGARPVEDIPNSDTEAVNAVRQWLRQRILTLIDQHPTAAEEVARRWPNQIAPLREQRHTFDDLNTVADLLDDVERNHQIPFGAPRPKVA